MKLKVLAVSLLALLAVIVLAPSAFAGRYYIPLPRAKHIAREEAEETCEQEAGCTSYGWGCEARGGGASCIVSVYYDEGALGESKCEYSLHLVIGSGGVIRRTYGHPHCLSV